MFNWVKTQEDRRKLADYDATRGILFWPPELDAPSLESMVTSLSAREGELSLALARITTQRRNAGAKGREAQRAKREAVNGSAPA